MEASDLLREWWAIIRMYTQKPPGPVVRKMLNRAGISVNAKKGNKALNLKSIDTRKVMPKINIENMGPLSMAAPVAGGALRDYAAKALVFGLLTFGILDSVLKANDIDSAQMIGDAVQNIAAPRNAGRNLPPFHETLADRFYVVVPFVVGMVGLGVHAHYEGDEEGRREAEQQLEEARRQFEQRAEVAGELVHNLRELPVEEEELVIESSANDPEVDPISFTEFSTGDIVAVIKDNKKQMLLVHGLEAWINGTPELQQNPRHPVTREPFTIDDVKLYRLKVVPKQSGGKKKVSRKRRTMKKRMTRRR
jgi:hypothetical protein